MSDSKDTDVAMTIEGVACVFSQSFLDTAKEMGIDPVAELTQVFLDLKESGAL